MTCTNSCRFSIIQGHIRPVFRLVFRPACCTPLRHVGHFEKQLFGIVETCVAQLVVLILCCFHSGVMFRLGTVNSVVDLTRARTAAYSRRLEQDFASYRRLAQLRASSPKQCEYALVRTVMHQLFEIEPSSRPSGLSRPRIQGHRPPAWTQTVP